MISTRRQQEIVPGLFYAKNGETLSIYPQDANQDVQCLKKILCKVLPGYKQHL